MKYCNRVLFPSAGSWSGSEFLLGVLILFGLGGCAGNQPVVRSPQAIPVKLQRLDSNVLEDATEFVGNLEAVKKVQLRAQIEGEITEIPVIFGQRVQQGELLFRLEPAQTAPQLAGVNAQVNAAEMALKSAEANLEQTIAQRGTIESELEFNKTNFQRAKTLVDEGVAPQVSLDEKTKRVDINIAQLRAQDKVIRASRAAVNQAQANLRNAKTQVNTALVPYQLKQIRSPINGVIGNFNVRVGDYITAGQVLTTINQNDFFDLVIPVPTTYANQLRQGVSVSLIDPQSNEVLSSEGSIAFISPVVNNSAQSITTRARFPNPNGRLRDNQNVKARVTWNRRSGVLIPVTAVAQIGGQAFVFVAQKTPCREGEPPLVSDLIVCQRLIKVGEIQGQNYQAIEGLKPGDTIAVSNILSLRNGTPIRPES
ncbi:efflux RND transporter periplasmic adaptor subunit [Pseudanabaena sp. PCC 6802]|uniref:efflux RND transporter periplasmic adaptor subunit n=1 Tax=Pseudanabaena sp. PCC 6802 TaxID=118173 RepID=UPI000364AF9E|nr:efflux RND transporter periplasmic adaptor subunit [Pseudanabaena sp. PCC 6802]